MRKAFAGSVLLGLLVLALAWLGLMNGSTAVPATSVWAAFFPNTTPDALIAVVREVRLPQVITAILAGSGLAVGGLLMQAVFRNPLAGPGVLGITGGASLGVALVVLARPIWVFINLSPSLLATVAGLFGALAVLVLIVLADRRLGDAATLLIVGLMVGYLCSAFTSLLQAASEARAVKGFVLWGFGSFAGTTLADLPWLFFPVLVATVVALTLGKALNALMLGEQEASALGVATARVRLLAIAVTGVLAGTITAWCGPIAFLGLAVPHVARALFRTADHRVLLPMVVLLGAALALACDLLVRAFPPLSGVPLNVVTSLLGVPVVLWVLLQGRKWGSSR
ncbi:MAG: iron ABC transporter permease [Flavobacteriales bacterium]|nr:iron ABC transporter permease [Flavobacteriales bacterium]